MVGIIVHQFKYRPPFSYLLQGIIGMAASILFASAAITGIGLFLSIIIILFCLLMLAYGIGFLTLYLKNRNSDDLVIGKDHIKIPGRWDRTISISFNEIKNIRELVQVHSNTIEIYTADYCHLIEKNWMKEDDYEFVVEFLMDWTAKNLITNRK